MMEAWVAKVGKTIEHYSIHIHDTNTEPHFFTTNKQFAETYKYNYSLLKQRAKQCNGKFVAKAYEIDVETEHGEKFKEYLKGFAFQKRKDANKFLRDVIEPFIMSIVMRK